jgi:hypothetical protein
MAHALNKPRAMRFAVVLLVAAACRPPGYGKEPDVDASMTGSGSGSGSMTVTPDAGAGSNAATCDHAFRIEGHGSDSSVWLTGTMLNWAGDPGAGAIQFTLGSDGAWTGNYAFPTGTHQYKLIVNGSNWILDPSNPDTADDGMGHTNNVFTCSPP